MLKEILPVGQTISTSGLRNRVWAVGQELDDHAESAIRGERDYPPADSHVKIVALAVDSAWLRHRPSRKEQDEAKLSQYYPSKRSPPTRRHVNRIVGRVVRDNGSCKVYGYGNREVTSAAARLDQYSGAEGQQWSVFPYGFAQRFGGYLNRENRTKLNAQPRSGAWPNVIDWRVV